MTELTLITNPPAAAATQADTQRPVPTKEFLARRILALPLGEQSIGAALTEMAGYLHPDAGDSLRRASTLSDSLMLIGIWVFPQIQDEDRPTYGMVVRPEKLVKRYPELKRVAVELAELELELPQSKA